MPSSPPFCCMVTEPRPSLPRAAPSPPLPDPIRAPKEPSPLTSIAEGSESIKPARPDLTDSGAAAEAEVFVVLAANTCKPHKHAKNIAFVFITATHQTNFNLMMLLPRQRCL